MNTPLKCTNCKKPITLKGHVVQDKQGLAYVLCPFANCQTRNYLPVEYNGRNSNPELKDINELSASKRK